MLIVKESDKNVNSDQKYHILRPERLLTKNSSAIINGPSKEYFLGVYTNSLPWIGNESVYFFYAIASRVYYAACKLNPGILDSAMYWGRIGYKEQRVKTQTDYLHCHSCAK